MRKMLISLPIILLLLSCGSLAHVSYDSQHDEFTGISYEQLRFRTIATLGMGYHDLTFRAFGDGSQYVAIRYHGSNWKFIERLHVITGESRRSYEYHRPNSDRQVVSNGVIEWAVFPLSDRALETLLSGDSFRYEARGSRGKVSGELSDDHLVKLREFFADHER